MTDNGEWGGGGGPTMIQDHYPDMDEINHEKPVHCMGTVPEAQRQELS